jgi:starch synthase
MACGVPTVACRVGGLPELVRHDETGFLVDPDDQAAFASRLRTLCVDHERVRSMGLAAAERAAVHFASAPLVDRYEELYKRARGATLLFGGERWKESGSI